METISEEDRKRIEADAKLYSLRNAPVIGEPWIKTGYLAGAEHERTLANQEKIKLEAEIDHWKAENNSLDEQLEEQKGKVNFYQPLYEQADTTIKFLNQQLEEKDKEIERLKKVILENSGQFTREEIEQLLK